jgi:methyl-accepting chemotaxis protein
VVADEVRALSIRSAASGQQMKATIDTIVQAINTAVSAVEDNTKTEIKMINSSEETIDEVANTFEELAIKLSTASAMMQDMANATQHKIGNVIVSLQFQDRVSQVVGSIDHSLKTVAIEIQQLDDRVKSDSHVSDLLDNWLQTLRASYTMSEQNDVHASGAINTHSSSEDDIELF